MSISRKKGMMATDLQELHSAILGAQFDLARECCDRIDWPDVYQTAKEQGLPDSLAAISMSAELLDYVGDFPRAKERLSAVEEEAEQRLRLLVNEGRGRPKSIEDRRVLKHWVWIVIQLAMVSYREIQFDRTLRLITICEDAILGSIRAVPAYPCSGTLARIYYVIGLVYRERFNFALAKQNFLKSIEFAWRSVREKADGPSGDTRQSGWTDLAIARSLALGLGFVYHSEGQPDLALPVLLSAKNLLAHLNEKLISTYVDLIYFDARRSAYGSDREIVDESIEGLRQCHATFVDVKHDLYRARAAYSLALAYSQRARADETKPLNLSGEHDLAHAESYSNELAEYGAKYRDSRAESYALLCRSRIERKRNHLAEAERLAADTMRLVGDTHAHVYVSALIAHAEAKARLGDLDAALADFQEASQRATGNLRSRAICLLRMAEIYAKTDRSKLASQCFQEWNQISSHVSNAYLRRLERTAEAAIGTASSDFVVRLTDNHLDREDLERGLHQFLTRWAESRTKSDQKAADLLGISRQTLLNWRNDKKKAG
jgi:tetratricopeptide (TPR) repeat protein